MTIDSIIQHEIGPLGKWQVLTLLLAMMPSEIAVVMIPQLANLAPRFACGAPWFDGWTYGQVFNFSSTVANASAPPDLSCRRFDLSSVASVLRSNTSMAEKIAEAAGRNLSLTSCPGPWVFDSDSAPYRRSLIEDFELVCDRKMLIPYSLVSYAIGIGIGQLLGGQLSDRFGRLRVLRLSLVLVSFVLFSVCLCENIWVFLVMRTLIAIILSVSYVSGVSLYIETTNDRHRVTLNFLSGLNYCLFGGPVIILLSYLLQDWRYVHLSSGVLILCFAVACFFALEESPRWLVAKGRYTAALRVVRWAARLNTGDRTRGDDITFADLKPSVAELEMLEAKGCAVLFKDWVGFFRSPGILRRILPLMWIWPTLGMTFYGVTFYTVRLDGNPYLIAYAMMITAAPSDVLKYFVVAKFGRKVGLAILLLGAVIFMTAGFAATVIPNCPETVVIVMATLALGCISAAFVFVYMYSPELFDTVQRSKAIGFCSFLARFGMVGGSFVERLDQFVWRPLPLLICAAALSLAFLAALFLPPDAERTLRDADAGADAEMELQERLAKN